MVRPTYPPLYHESEFVKLKRDIDASLVVVHDSWKVGDFVDWCKDGCYWSGTIVELKDNDVFKVIESISVFFSLFFLANK